MRIIIADDEVHIRRRFVEKMDWESLGVDEVVACSDGDEVLEAVRDGGADLLLTDIRMPRMDGISAARQARGQCPDMAVILMSAYDDKDYLKSALDLRAVGYLEKPFAMSDARALIEKAIQELRRSLGRTDADLQLRRTGLMEASAALLRGEALDAARREALGKDYPAFFGGSGAGVMLLRLREDEEFHARRLRAQRLWELLEGFGGRAILLGIDGESAVLGLAGDRDEAAALAGEVFARLAGALCPGEEREKGNRVLTAAVGYRAAAPEALRDAYGDAAAALERMFYHDVPLAFAWELGEGSQWALSEEMEKSFRLILQRRSRSACRRFLENVREELLAHDLTPVRDVKNFYFHLALALLEGRKTGESARWSEVYMWELFYRTDSLLALDAFMAELVQVCFEDAPDARPGADIDAIVAWVDAHISDPELNLSSISSRFYLSVTCLCMLFKERTGMTVKAYVIESRMRRAADMLRMTDMMVAEVARSTGFTDQGYFTKSFSKRFGVSPSRYKEENG